MSEPGRIEVIEAKFDPETDVVTVMLAIPPPFVMSWSIKTVNGEEGVWLDADTFLPLLVLNEALERCGIKHWETGK